MSKPKLLDLFCGAGGAAEGYHRVGFEVVGVDIAPQPNYPFQFWQADAMDTRDWPPLSFDAIHASPPCQQFTVLRNCRPSAEPRWADLIANTRELCEASGLPWVIENTPKAPLRRPVQLCGTSFGLRVRRHRLFEVSFPLMVPQCDHGRFRERVFPGSSNRPNGRTVCNIGEYRVPLSVQRECMGIDWSMTLHELSEAIPPTYTEFIGRYLMAEVKSRVCQ